MPIHFATDRECIENIAPTTGKVDSSLITIAWIQNTLELTRMMLSDNLREEVEANSDLEILGPAQDFCFDKNGDLPSRLDIGATRRGPFPAAGS
jgi:hypothetical protein